MTDQTSLNFICHLSFCGWGLHEIAEHGLQFLTRLIEQRRRLRPLFQDDGTREAALLDAPYESLNAGSVLCRRPGEDRQMAVTIAVVLVQMDVDDRHLRIQQVHELEVIIARWAAEIGMAKIQTHSHCFFRNTQGAQPGEQFVEVLRGGERRVFDGKPDACLRATFCQGEQSFYIRIYSKLRVQVDVAIPGGVPDVAAGFLADLARIPAGARSPLVRKPLKGIKAILNTVFERVAQGCGGEGRLVPDPDLLSSRFHNHKYRDQILWGLSLEHGFERNHR